MAEVNVSELNSDEVGIKYLEIIKEINKLEKLKAVLRSRILELNKEGYNLKSVGVTVVMVHRLDLTKSKDAWLEAGKKLPMKTIPAQEVLDTAKFTAMLDFEENVGIKKTVLSYQVRTKKGR